MGSKEVPNLLKKLLTFAMGYIIIQHASSEGRRKYLIRGVAQLG